MSVSSSDQPWQAGLPSCRCHALSKEKTGIESCRQHGDKRGRGRSFRPPMIHTCFGITLFCLSLSHFVLVLSLDHYFQTRDGCMDDGIVRPIACSRAFSLSIAPSSLASEYWSFKVLCFPTARKHSAS
ncbi:hypothetical protein MPTK1_8g09950 [Marchantia polymorpha subsp. ruderalis]|uniref:Uncharacterized protein n=1 Tax=Marchantia polymorpha TaxID=3197 RepID=A0A2R6XMY3_MARPO|nr:hypothetical protein MARPO_0008s0226 [Marchantia polymorpha]BBN19352.1 hypothetical protein Mp_8g09950 [Marchantia polymorpha subsp. ruderalis]|eukprot:PTQ47480.1 hypothetical protein MARPO_0008s0226 [Marchantia polymorpha]